MRRSSFALIPVGAMLAIHPVSAQTADPARPFALHGNLSGVSDYRFRGLSQSNRRAAVQGGLTVNHRSGAYVGLWSSTISDYVAVASPAELDLFAGYKASRGATTFDGGLLYYVYPDTPGSKTNFFEPYANVSHGFGPITAKVGANYAWHQRALSLGAGKRGGLYAYTDFSAAVPTTALSVTGHLGHSFQRDLITLGTHYTDWSVTAAYTHSAMTLSVGYVDTNRHLYSYPAGGGRNRDIAGAGVVGAMSFAF